MTTPTLTIAIPTYNRADCLQLLLDTLRVELRGLEGRIAVVIGDNASTDRTADVTHAFAASWHDTEIVRHPDNLGMDGNFCGCAERVRTPWFWMFGDDDLPRPGAIRALLELVEREQPDLVYLASDWQSNLADNDPAHPVGALQAVALDRLTFARRTNVWLTYLSGMIVRSTSLLQDPVRLREYAGTQLSQLSWVLAALRDGGRFIHVTTGCVLATQGNTGGYKVLQVFGRNFPEIVRGALERAEPRGRLPRAILRRTAVGFLPALVLGMRTASLGSFGQEDAAEVLRGEFGGTLAFTFLLRPIGHAARPVARAARLLASICNRLIKAADGLIEKRPGSVRVLAPIGAASSSNGSLR